ncbi:hypothetical protein H4S02_001062 [Coemansia sp. RSA 2611]|nr:hypothetical protein H4S02_001062 [Coemansia sp. RSA 2611]
MKLTAALTIGLAAVVSAKVSTEACSMLISKQIVNLYQSGFLGSYTGRCEKDDSGSGYASGYISFTTANGDALEVIKIFSQSANYTGVFDKYIDTLEKYAESGSGSTEGLDGYCDAWLEASSDLNFYPAQIAVANALYMNPSLQYAGKLKVEYAVSRAVLYDTAIVNGAGDDSDGLGGLIQATNAQFTKKATGNSGSTLSINGVKVDEMIWLSKFLDVRLSKNGAGDKANVDAYRYIIDQGHYDWNPSVKVPGPDGKMYTVDCSQLKN